MLFLTKRFKPNCFIKDGVSGFQAIHSAVIKQGYSEEIAKKINKLMFYLEKESWCGACYASSAILFVVLSELGLTPTLCIGETRSFATKRIEVDNYPMLAKLLNPNYNVTGYTKFFDHAWITVNDKIIDLACAMGLDDLPVNAPVIFDIDIYSGEKYKLEDINYGLYHSGLNDESKFIIESSFAEYMDNYPALRNGLWDIVRYILGTLTEKSLTDTSDIEILREKYKDTKWNYVCHY